MEEQTSEIPTKEQSSWTGIIIVIIIIALGGAYFWYVKSGAMKALDEHNQALQNQASPANLFK